MMKIIGVHAVEASQPCHLIELDFEPDDGPVDWGMVTQEDPDQPRANWQVAYDQRPLNDEATRWAFFFHYLDPSRPLLTPAGSLTLPAANPLPAHLRRISYTEP
jgi:hypothetical protein